MMMPREIADKWADYISEEKTGMRKLALVKLDALIDSLKDIPTSLWFPWALDVAEHVIDRRSDIPVRLPLFRDALFPALLDSLHRGSGSAARFLGGFSQLLYHSPGCLNRLPEHLRNSYDLTLEAIRLDRTDIKSKESLRQMLRGSFDYALHELPAGVLFGHNGASIEGCNELEKDLTLYSELSAELGRTHEDEELIAESEYHIPAYRDYLRNRDKYMNYSDYLLKHGRR